MSKDRYSVLIDGSNFYFKLRDLKLHNLLKFDFSAFVRYLTEGQEVVESCYYIGAVRTDGSKKAQKLFDNQQRLLSHLKKHNIRYSLGYLLKSERGFHGSAMSEV